MENQLLGLDQVDFIYPNGHHAVRQVSLQFGTGIVGLLGPNGAGKTSLMSMLATLTKPNKGKIYWRGSDITGNSEHLRAELGYLPQHFGVYPSLTAYEFLLYLAAVKGLSTQSSKEQVEKCLSLVGLSDVARKRLGRFSGGMLQRVGIAQALLNDPKLLVIDEPTVGLAPEERLRFRLLLSELGENRLIILSTHIVSDIELCASSLVIMNQGEIHFHDHPESLKQAAMSKVWEWKIQAGQLELVRAKFTLSRATSMVDAYLVRIVADERPHLDAVSVLPDLEDAYLYLLNQITKQRTI